MREYKLELTEGEIACGVTLGQVAELLPKVLMRRNELVILPKLTPPALAGATARCAFGAPAEFVGLNMLGQPLYRLSDEEVL